MPTAPPGYFAGLPTGYATGYHPGSGVAPPPPARWPLAHFLLLCQPPAVSSPPSAPPVHWPLAHFLLLCQPPPVAPAYIPASFIEAIGRALEGDGVLVGMLGMGEKVFYKQASVRTPLPYLVYTISAATPLRSSTGYYTVSGMIDVSTYAADQVPAAAAADRAARVLTAAADADAIVWSSATLLDLWREDFPSPDAPEEAPGPTGRIWREIRSFGFAYEGF